MGYGSNGFNSNGTCMNTGNQISARPSIRLYPGMSSGGSFASFCGGAEDHARAATKIMKEVKTKPLHAHNNHPINPAPKSRLKQPVVIDNKIRNDENRPDESLRPQETTQPVSNFDNQGYGIGNRVLPDRHTDKPLGGEVQAGYGIGNRRADRQPIANKQCEATSLSFGSENNQARRAGRRRGGEMHRPGEVPDWMSGKTVHRAIDCTPAIPDQNQKRPESDFTAPAGVPAMSRDEFDRLYDKETEHLVQDARAKVAASTGARPYVCETSTSVAAGSSAAGMSSNKHQRFSLEGETRQKTTDEERAQMRQAAEARQKSRPF